MPRIVVSSDDEEKSDENGNSSESVNLCLKVLSIQWQRC